MQSVEQPYTIVTMQINDKDFNERLKSDLHNYLMSVGEIDTMMPDAPDIEWKWEELAQAYLPDGIREFGAYPTVSLGWMMYVGMAVAKMWDKDWATFSKIENLYAYIRDQRGYDCMDEYIREEILEIHGEEYDRVEKIVGECASRTHAMLRRETIEPGTKQAFEAYVTCIKQLYLMGAAMQLHRMGYKMTPLG